MTTTKCTAILAATLALVLPAAAQSVFSTTPNWASSDTQVSTGGALVDLDRDGWLDFVVANGNDMARQHLAVYYNTGAGTFPATPNWQSTDSEYNGHIAVADVNGDGWPDVAVGLTTQDAGTPAVRLYLNNAGTLSSLPDWESNVDYAGFQVSFGDVNGDGRPDLAVGTGWPYSSPHQWHNYVYFNVDGMLEATPSWASSDVWDLGDVLFCDVDRDGWLDLVGIGEGTYTWIYFNNAGTLATTATWRTTDNDDQFSVMGTYGDLGTDGRYELFVTDNDQLGGGSGLIRRYDGTSGITGAFTQTPTWSFYEGYGSAVALADLDADGDLDLATGGWWGHTRYFLNTAGILPPTASWSSSGTSVVEAIVFGDVDRDGLRYPVDTLPAQPGIHLYKLTRRPIDDIQSVLVDGVALNPDQYTADFEHGWISVGSQPQTSVTVAYAYTLKPDMGITNWDNNRGNYLYYNQNTASTFADLDDDGDADAADFALFTGCLSGPSTEFPTGCDAGDIDLDDDVDLVDFAAFALFFTGS